MCPIRIVARLPKPRKYLKGLERRATGTYNSFETICTDARFVGIAQDTTVYNSSDERRGQHKVQTCWLVCRGLNKTSPVTSNKLFLARNLRLARFAEISVLSLP